MRTMAVRQNGFALIIVMIILAVMSILVVNSVRNATLGEKMAGSYMDRTRAQQAAEQALRQGEAILIANGKLCLAGCAVSSTAVVTSSTAAATVLPAAWPGDAGAVTATTATGQVSSAKYVVSLLGSAFVPASPSVLNKCKPYSIMGKGVGADTSSIVVLQTVAFVCSVQ